MSLSGVLMRKGAPAVFSRTVPGSYDQTTDTTGAPVTTTYPGRAMQVEGDVELYKALELIESENPTLEWKPDTPGVMPPLGATIVWGGQTFTIKNIRKNAMNGTATEAFIVVGR